MYKIRDFVCTKCECDFESMVQDNEAPACPKCSDSEFVKRGVPTAPGGYKIKGDNGASITPKGSGAWKKHS